MDGFRWGCLLFWRRRWCNEAYLFLLISNGDRLFIRIVFDSERLVERTFCHFCHARRIQEIDFLWNLWSILFDFVYRSHHLLDSYLGGLSCDDRLIQLVIWFCFFFCAHFGTLLPLKRSNIGFIFTLRLGVCRFGDSILLRLNRWLCFQRLGIPWPTVHGLSKWWVGFLHGHLPIIWFEERFILNFLFALLDGLWLLVHRLPDLVSVLLFQVSNRLFGHDRVITDKCVLEFWGFGTVPLASLVHLVFDFEGNRLLYAFIIHLPGCCGFRQGFLGDGWRCDRGRHWFWDRFYFRFDWQRSLFFLFFGDGIFLYLDTGGYLFLLLYDYGFNFRFDRRWQNLFFLYFNFGLFFYLDRERILHILL